MPCQARHGLKRKLGLHAFGVIKGNIKMIALLRGVIPTGKNRIPKLKSSFRVKTILKIIN